MKSLQEIAETIHEATGAEGHELATIAEAVRDAVQGMASPLFVRVSYRPRGQDGDCWLYGWVFAAQSMPQANDALRRIARLEGRKWVYRIEPVHQNDFDHPVKRTIARAEGGAV